METDSARHPGLTLGHAWYEPMDATLLLHKPVIYGSDFANLLFNAVLGLHFVAGAIATAAGTGALISAKGGKRHIRAGQCFAWAMIIAVGSGMGLDAVRITINVGPNHADYPGLASPSTVPARYAFLYAGLGVLYLLFVGWPARLRSRTMPTGAVAMAAPLALFITGLALTALIFLRHNPWTGALWMIWTFMGLVTVCAWLSRAAHLNDTYRRRQHRFTMLAILAFAWWASAQGFGPAIARMMLDGQPTATLPPSSGISGLPFWLFLAGWAPAFLIAGILYRRYARRRDPNPAPGDGGGNPRRG